jgi:peptidoglycan hydrolase CwlO-like protein
MNLSDILAGLTSIIALVGSGIAVYLAWRKAPHEMHKIEADVSGVWQDQLIKAQGHIERLDNKVEKLERLAQEQEDRIACLEAENADLRDWADSLVSQVKAQGLEPVKLKTRKATG